MLRILTPSFIIFCLFMLGGMVFKTTAPTRCSMLIPSDIAFVLTGDSRRIPFAMRQMRRQPKMRMYIIGEGSNNGYASDRVIVRPNSKTTYQNAIAIKQIVNAQGLDRIVLITTVDHFNRARYLIKQQLPDIEIVACPAPLNGMHATKRLERWTTEYIKYLGTLIGINES